MVVEAIVEMTMAAGAGAGDGDGVGTRAGDGLRRALGRLADAGVFEALSRLVGFKQREGLGLGELEAIAWMPEAVTKAAAEVEAGAESVSQAPLVSKAKGGNDGRSAVGGPISFSMGAVESVNTGGGAAGGPISFSMGVVVGARSPSPATPGSFKLRPLEDPPPVSPVSPLADQDTLELKQRGKAHQSFT